jgi:hypothetical protein
MGLSQELQWKVLVIFGQQSLHFPLVASFGHLPSSQHNSKWLGPLNGDYDLCGASENATHIFSHTRWQSSLAVGGL